MQTLMTLTLWGMLTVKWDNADNRVICLTECLVQIECSISIIKLLTNIKTDDKNISLSNWNKTKIVILIMAESLFVLLPYLIFFVALPLSSNHIIDLFIYTVFMFTLQEHEVHEGGLFVNVIVFNKSGISTST